MQRDIGNEFIVAIVAVGVLAIAVAFAIILSLSGGAGQPVEAQMEGSVTEAIAEETAFTTMIAMITSTPVETSETEETPPSKTGTSLPVIDASATGLPPTQTITPFETTSPTRTASQIPTATRAILQPSSTPLPTAVEATISTSPTLTSTIQIITRTIIPTNTATKTATPIPSATSTLTTTPSATATLVPSATTSPTATSSPTPLPTNTKTPTVVPIEGAEGCTSPESYISNLKAGQTVQGKLRVMGSAQSENFWYYKVEIRPDFATTYTVYSRSEEMVIENELAVIDTDIFEQGAYWIQLTVVNKDNSVIRPCAIPLNIQR